MGRVIQKIIKQWKEEAGTDRIVQWKLCMDKTLKIYTSQPGWLIGKGGVLIDKYNKIFKQELGTCFEKIEIVETDWLWA